MVYNAYFKLLITCNTKHELLQEEAKPKSKQRTCNISDVLIEKRKVVELEIKFKQIA
jgi:hypothetical protein